MRLFICIEPDPTSSDEIIQLCQGVDGVRWSCQSQLHLTLAFLGERNPAELEGLIEVLSRVEFSPFTIDCGGIGYFNSGVLWLGVNAQSQAPRLTADTASPAVTPAAPKNKRHLAGFTPFSSASYVGSPTPLIAQQWTG